MNLLDFLKRAPLIFILAPFSLLLSSLVRIPQAFFDLITINWKEISSYKRFSIYRSMNSSWHRAYEDILSKYGRKGYVTELGFGTPIAPMFYLTRISCFLYTKLEILIPPLSILLAVLSGAIFMSLEELSNSVVISILVVTLFSSNFYYFAFESMKYDAMGWLLVPLGYFMLLNDQFFAFSLIFLAISYLSISTLIVQGAIWFALAVLSWEIYAILAMVPAGIKFLTHFKFLFYQRGNDELVATLDLIGLTEKGKKARKRNISRKYLYFSALWLLFLCAFIAFGSSTEFYSSLTGSVMLLLIIILYWINTLVARFADTQTMYITYWFAAFVIVLTQPFNIFLFTAFIIVTNSCPIFLGFADHTDKNNLYLSKPPKLKPFYTNVLDHKIEDFFQKCSSGDRILFDTDFSADEHPDFGGWRAFKEYLHRALLLKGCSLVPDFYTIKYQHRGDIDFASIMASPSVETRHEAAKTIGAKFIIHPSESEEVDEKWIKIGYQSIQTLDLKNLKKEKLIPDQRRNKAQYFHLLMHKNETPSPFLKGEVISQKENHFTVKCDADGIAEIAYMYDPGWSSQEAEISKSEGKWPWITVKAAPNETVHINYSPQMRKS